VAWFTEQIWYQHVTRTAQRDGDLQYSNSELFIMLCLAWWNCYAPSPGSLDRPSTRTIIIAPVTGLIFPADGLRRRDEWMCTCPANLSEKKAGPRPAVNFTFSRPWRCRERLSASKSAQNAPYRQYKKKRSSGFRRSGQ
jgi:hypothetical protein